MTPGRANLWKGIKAPPKAIRTRQGADPGAGGPSVPPDPAESILTLRPPPLKSTSEERRGWGEVANISISEEVTCDPEGGSIVPLLRGTQTLVSLFCVTEP